MSRKKHIPTPPPQVDAPPATTQPVLGIDVSKLTLDTCLRHGGQSRHQQFANTPRGIAQLLAMLSARRTSPALVAMEATGPYSLAVATAAEQAGHRVAVLNPRRVLDYARACERRNKTDRVDAAIIARFAAQEENLPAWRPLPPEQDLLRALLRRQDDLNAHLHAEERRLEMAQKAAPLRQSLQRSVRWLRAELTRLEKSIQQHLATHSSLAVDVAHLQAIPGVGPKSARLLTAEIPRHFRNARAASAWVGVVPRQNTSGLSVHRPSRIGHAAPALRSKLYFTAITAIRCDPRSQVFAKRLHAAGLSKMAIIFAVLHKLVRTAFAILKTGTPYDPNHVVSLPTPCSP